MSNYIFISLHCLENIRLSITEVNPGKIHFFNRGGKGDLSKT